MVEYGWGRHTAQIDQSFQRKSTESRYWRRPTDRASRASIEAAQIWQGFSHISKPLGMHVPATTGPSRAGGISRDVGLIT